MTEVDREGLFAQLRHSLTLLASDGDTALAGVPDGCCKPDELALDYDNFSTAVLGNFAADLSPDLVMALRALHAVFDDIHGDGWTEDAVRSSREWAVIRQLATEALTQFKQP